MSLITISQSIGSADGEIARSVAKKLGLELFDDPQLRDRAKQLGIQSDDLKGLDEKAPGFLDRFLSSRPESYVEFMESVIYEVAKTGQGIIMGHGSQILLQDFSCALHVLIHAPESYRVEYMVKKQGLNPEDAQRLIKKSDNERRRFFNFAFSLNWDDPSLYDLVVNPGKLGNEAAANLIVQTAGMDEIKTCSLTALETMERRSHERAVRAVLLKSGINMSLLNVEVPRKGSVLLKGFSPEEDDKQRAIDLAKTVPGITEVEHDIAIVTRYDA